MIATIAFVGCQPSIDETNEIDEGPLLIDDPIGVRDLNRIREILINTKQIVAADFDRLLQLDQKYPRTADIVVVLVEAYVSRGDWIGLCEYYDRLPDRFRNAKLSAEALIKAGRIAEAIQRLEQYREKMPDYSQWALLLAQALYQDGQTDRGNELIDPWLSRLTGAELTEARVLRATAALQQDQTQLAHDLLARAVASDPQHIGAVTAWAQVLRRRGETDKADEMDARALQLRNENREKMQTAARLASLSIDLEIAFAAEEYDRCESIVNEMLQYAEPPMTEMLQRTLDALQRRRQ